MGSVHTHVMGASLSARFRAFPASRDAAISFSYLAPGFTTATSQVTSARFPLLSMATAVQVMWSPTPFDEKGGKSFHGPASHGESPDRPVSLDFRPRFEDTERLAWMRAGPR